MDRTRCRRIRLHGEQWRIVFGPVRGKWGETDWAQRTITVDPDSDHSGDYEAPVSFLEVAIHEALHAIFPFVDEDYIDVGARELTDYLEKLDL